MLVERAALERDPERVLPDGAVLLEDALRAGVPVAVVAEDAGLDLAGDLPRLHPRIRQVESDPAVLNLTAYESFFDERRPFFVAGRGLFQFNVNCSQVNCGGEGLYYSRRIGRTPALAGVHGDTVPQDPITILGAAKLIGRFPRG